MLVFGQEGRLGNQLFQYAFLKTIQKNNERIVVFGFDELKSLFNIEGVLTISKNNRLLKKIIYKIVKPILCFLARFRVISSIQIKKVKGVDGYFKESTEYTHSTGILKKVTYIIGGTFHSEYFFSPTSIDNLVIKRIYVKKAQKCLAFLPKNYHKVFVHIRRGDYKKYTVYGRSTLLSCQYFDRQIEWFENNIPNSYFIFLSDEANYIKENFPHIKNKVIIEGSAMGTDFAIMTLCDSGILSPSSFGWWGSYMMANRHVVIAPRYWLGFNSCNEYPESPYPSFVKLAESYCPE